jgi:hypothetical protein
MNGHFTLHILGNLVVSLQLHLVINFLCYNHFVEPYLSYPCFFYFVSLALTLSMVMPFIIIAFTLIPYVSYLEVYLIPAFKISSFPSQSEHCTILTFSLVISSSLPPASFNSLLCCVLLAVSFALLITLSYLVMTLCLLSKISIFPSHFGSGILLIPPFGRNLIFATRQPGLSFILCCTRTLGSLSFILYCTRTLVSPAPSPLPLHPCLLSPLTLVIFVSSPKCLP